MLFGCSLQCRRLACGVERLTGVPLDADDSVSYVLLAAPTFAKIDDLLQGKTEALHAHHLHLLTSCFLANVDLPRPVLEGCLRCNLPHACLPAGLDFAYPEAAKIGGMVSGPPQQGGGARASPPPAGSLRSSAGCPPHRPRPRQQAALSGPGRPR